MTPPPNFSTDPVGLEPGAHRVDNNIYDTIGFGCDPRMGEWRSPCFTCAVYSDRAASQVDYLDEGAALVRFNNLPTPPVAMPGTHRLT